jgi:hypothetical protein
MRRRDLSKVMFAAGTGLISQASHAQPAATPKRAPSAAEEKAAVVPADTDYPPGDLRRYGAVAGGDITRALLNAASQANQENGAAIYIASALGSSRITAGVTFDRPVSIFGDDYQNTVISTGADITVFTFNAGAAGSVVRDLHLAGKGPGANRPGILVRNCPCTNFTRIWVRRFGVGVRYAPGANSSYLNTIIASSIISNNEVNIDAQARTNQLALYQVTFGGGPSRIGIRVVDSSGLTIYGGDCEGVTVCCVDLDATTNAPAFWGGHLISGCDFEGNTCSEGDVRIGNTHAVRAVQLSNMTLAPGHGNRWFVNPLNCDGLLVLGCHIESGYASGDWINRTGNLTNLVSLGNGAELDGNTSSPVGHVYNNFATARAHPEPWRTPATFDPNYRGGASANQYAVLSSDLDVPDGHWYAGLDVMNVVKGGAPAPGVKVYARAMIGHNSRGPDLKVGAAYMQGDVDINGALGINGQATSGSQTATFAAGNKPGASGTRPARWLPIKLDGTIYYIPCWT